jgi:glycosyltransferase involved in cell wall biosynthesis
MYLISDLSIGGAELTLYRLLSKIDRQRFEPVVVSLVDRGSLRDRFEALGIEVQTLGINASRPSVVDLFRLIKLINRVRPNLLVGWMYHSCLAAELATRFTRQRVPTIWSLHCAINPASVEKRRTVLIAKLCALLSGLPTKIVLVSNAAKRQLKQLRYQTETCFVIPNGIEITRFAPSKDAQDAMRKALGLPGEVTLVGLVGRYHPVKDHENFLRAAASVRSVNSDVHFVLAGRGVDEMNRQLIHLINELGLKDRVHLLGERDDTTELMASFDICALSSFDESCPNVVGEAMACGVPCVVTNVGDAALIVGDTGRVVPARDSTALAIGLLELIDLGFAGRQALGARARTRITELFSLDRIANEYESLFDTVLSQELPDSISTGTNELSPAWKASLIHGPNNL